MEMPEGLYLESIVVTGYVHEEDGCFTVYSLGEGGAVVSDKDKDTAERKFEVATKAAYALRNLIFFKTAVEEAAKKREKKMITPTLEFKFVEA